jgi:peroxiredoxin
MQIRSAMAVMMVVLGLFCGAIPGGIPGYAAEPPPAVGAVLPELTLPAPQNPTDLAYLGTKGEKPFKIPQIQADIVVLEIFSMYCPYCQREAPRLNEFYELIAKRRDLKHRVKIIGIGAGNSAFEVKVFRDQYKVPFPLFPDENFAFHKAYGDVRTPYFVGIRINADGSHKVIYSKLGTIDDPAKFLDLLVKQAGSQ